MPDRSEMHQGGLDISIDGECVVIQVQEDISDPTRDRLLYVDPEMAKELAMLLTRASIKVETAADGQ